MEYSLIISTYWIDIMLSDKVNARLYDWRAYPDGARIVIKDEYETFFLEPKDSIKHNGKTYDTTNIDALSIIILDKMYKLPEIKF
jgi:hypothetical protein